MYHRELLSKEAYIINCKAGKAAALPKFSDKVCFIKFRSKHNSNTLLCLRQIFMKQTLNM